MSTITIEYEKEKLTVSYVKDTDYNNDLYATSIIKDGVDVPINWLNEITISEIESLVAKAIAKENIEGFGSLHSFHQIMDGFDNAIRQLEAA